MATLYLSKNDPDSVLVNNKVIKFIESGIPKSEAKEQVKKLNRNLSQEEIDMEVEYDYLRKDYDEEEFYNIMNSLEE